jgi:hypothetical protein
LYGRVLCLVECIGSNYDRWNSRGTEWGGAGSVTVNYDPSAPLGNFGTPSNVNHAVGYDIFTTGDANYFYVGLKAASNGDLGVLFSNLYFDLDHPTNPGSDLGFELTNDRAFIPGVPGYSGPISGVGVLFATASGTPTSPMMIEAAFPWSIFTSDPLGMGYPLAMTEVQLRLSQSLGFSVAGGATYGDDRLGTLAVPTAAVPETSSILVFGLVALVVGLAAKFNVLTPVLSLIK